jgi:hypothetical protein
MTSDPHRNVPAAANSASSHRDDNCTPRSTGIQPLARAAVDAPAQEPGHRAALLGPNEVLTFEGLVSEQERRDLAEWAQARYRAGQLRRNPQDPGAFSTEFCSASGLPTRPESLRARRGTAAKPLVWLPAEAATAAPLPAAALKIRERVVALLGLQDFDDDPYKGSFISVIEPGTGVHQHRDERLVMEGEDRPILRCNLFLQQPGAGGDPVFDGRLRLDLPEGGMWAFFPTELVHSATPVEGTAVRVLLSMGFLGYEAQWLQRRFTVDSKLLVDLAVPRPAAGMAAGRSATTVPAGLFDRMSQALVSAGVQEECLALLRYAMVRGAGGFRLAEAGQELALQAPRLHEAAAQLQRGGILVSESSRRQAGERVWVL